MNPLMGKMIENKQFKFTELNYMRNTWRKNNLACAYKRAASSISFAVIILFPYNGAFFIVNVLNICRVTQTSEHYRSGAGDKWIDINQVPSVRVTRETNKAKSENFFSQYLGKMQPSDADWNEMLCARPFGESMFTHKYIISHCLLQLTRIIKLFLWY